MKLVINPAVEAERLEKIQAVGDIQVANTSDEAEAIREIADADAFFGKITPPMLAAAEKLRWVQTGTVSLEHYVFPELIDHPCQLSNMRGLFSDVIADQVMGYVICFARNLHTYIRNQLRRHWEPEGGEGGRVHFAAGPGVVNDIDRRHGHLAGETLGVVGLGAIGGEIARRALAFGMRVIAVDPRQTEAPEGVEALWPIDRIDDLLAQSDYVVVAAPHTPQTERMFDRQLFQKMKPTARFINIGRGAIVILDDLVAALKANEIAGAALDVYEIEPLPAEHPLWDFPNVILTPHVAGYSTLIAQRHLNLLLDNLGRFLRSEELKNVVDKAMWF